MEDALDSGEGPAHRAPVAQLEAHALGVEVRDRQLGRVLLDPQPQLVTALAEQARDV